MVKYSRILLKLSGESIGGKEGNGIEESVLSQYAGEIAEILTFGVEVAVVIGGGNIFRGIPGTERGFDRVKGDQMGMLATVINSIALSVALSRKSVESRVYTSTKMEPYATYYTRESADKSMRKGKVAIIAGGTGNPFFTTDSASALRAAELGVSALLKGTRVDGIYTADPEREPAAVKYRSLTYNRAIEENLKVMDMTAFAICRENKIPIVVFDMNRQGNLLKLIKGEDIGTLVHGS